VTLRWRLLKKFLDTHNLIVDFVAEITASVKTNQQL